MRRAPPAAPPSPCLVEYVERRPVDVDGAITEEVAEALLQRLVFGELGVSDADDVGDDEGSGRQLGLCPEMRSRRS